MMTCCGLCCQMMAVILRMRMMMMSPSRRFLGSDEDDLGDEDDAELLSILGIGGGDAPPAVPVASSESYDTMKVPELKALLKEKGLKVGGKKAELVARLRERARVTTVYTRANYPSN